MVKTRPATTKPTTTTSSAAKVSGGAGRSDQFLTLASLFVAVTLCYVLYGPVDAELHSTEPVSWYAVWAIRYPFLLRLGLITTGLGVALLWYTFDYISHRRGGFGGEGFGLMGGVFLIVVGSALTVFYILLAYAIDGWVINPPPERAASLTHGMKLLIPHSVWIYVLWFGAIAGLIRLVKALLS